MCLNIIDEVNSTLEDYFSNHSLHLKNYETPIPDSYHYKGWQNLKPLCLTLIFWHEAAGSLSVTVFFIQSKLCD